MIKLAVNLDNFGGKIWGSVATGFFENKVLN